MKDIQRMNNFIEYIPSDGEEFDFLVTLHTALLCLISRKFCQPLLTFERLRWL